MSIFKFPIEVGSPTGERFKRVGSRVDTGASYTLAPGTFLESLGHTPDRSLQSRLADGTITELSVSRLTVRINRDTRAVSCVYGGDCSDSLLGATALEEFALGAYPLKHTLVPVVVKLLGFNPENNEN